MSNVNVYSHCVHSIPVVTCKECSEVGLTSNKEIKKVQAINDLVYSAFMTAKKKGFWESLELNHTVVLAKLALITSEIGEAVEATRKENFGNLSEELADICIRVFDLAGALQYDLEGEILSKMLINETRPYKHGKLA